ncbi:MAG: hypothetical protein NT031_13930 [Planctomycetota bacterium]|nr:hypothetical protein [Planctomycetota bacterium]
MLERITGPGRYSLPESLCLGVTEMWVVQVPGAITFDLCYPMPEMVEATKALVGMTDVAAGSPLRDALDAGFVPVTMNTVVAQPGKAWPYFKRLLSGSLTKEPACPYLVTSVMPMAVLLPVAVRGRLAVAERLIAKRLLQILGLIQ